MARTTPRTLVAISALVAGLTLLPAPGRAAEGAAETWFAEAITQSDLGVESSYLWSKGRKLRADVVVAGTPVVTIVNGATYYAIDGRSMVGTAIERAPKALADDAKGGRPFLNDGDRMIAMGGEKIGSERIAGRPCDIYRLTDSDGKKTIWMTQDSLHLPVKIELYGRTNGQTATTIINWSRGFEVPDAFFEPDPRFTLDRISYQEYVNRARERRPSAVPVLYGDLLHGH
jgi:outer membrane lipoprotein-sorting protein